MPPAARVADDEEPDPEELEAESALLRPILGLLDQLGLRSLTADAYSKPELLQKQAPHLGTEPLVYSLHPAELQRLVSCKFRSAAHGKLELDLDPLAFHCLGTKLYTWNPLLYKAFLPDGQASVFMLHTC